MKRRRSKHEYMGKTKDRREIGIVGLIYIFGHRRLNPMSSLLLM